MTECEMLKPLIKLSFSFQVATCNLYSKHLSPSVDVYFHEVEVQQRSEITSCFFEKYKNQLSKSSDLSEVVDSILKLTSNDSSHICEVFCFSPFET